MSLFVTEADSLYVSTSSLSFTLLFWPSQFPPSSLPSYLPPSSLGGRFLPVSTSPGGGEGCLSRASSTLPLSLLSLSLALSLCFLSAARSLSIRHSRTETVSITYRQVQVQRWHSLTLLRPVNSTQWSRCSRKMKMKKKSSGVMWGAWMTSQSRSWCQV